LRVKNYLTIFIEDFKIVFNNVVLSIGGGYADNIPGEYVVGEPEIVKNKKHPDDIIIKLQLSNGKDVYGTKSSKWRGAYKWYYDGKWYHDTGWAMTHEAEKLGAQIRKDLNINESVIKEWKNRRSDRIVRRAKELRVKTYDKLHDLIVDEFFNATGADVTIAAKELGISRFD